MTMDTATSQRMMGIIIDLENGRTIDDTDKGPVVIWGACMIPVGRFDRHGETGFIVDVVTVLNPNTVQSGLVLMASETAAARFSVWCSQNMLPQPDAKNVRKIINGLVADPSAGIPSVYVDGVGEVEHGLWALGDGVMAAGEFIPMEVGQHRETAAGVRVVYAPSISCEEICGPDPLDDDDRAEIGDWARDIVALFGSHAPLATAAWIRASVLRSRIEAKDAQIPALYVCGDSHRGKTLMSTVCMRMLGSRGERPHANMTTASNAGVFLAATRRSSLPFILDEVKPYMGQNDNDLVKSLVNGDVPMKSTRSGRLRSSTRIKSMPLLVSEFAPGDTSSITNRVFTLNLVTTGAMARGSEIHNWVWWADRHRDMYGRWAHSIYSATSQMTDDGFNDLWLESAEEARAICDDACMTLNRSVTATTILVMGFKLMNRDANGALDWAYVEFANTLSACLRAMSALVVEVSSMGRFITSLRSGWPAMENRYSGMVCDRVFTYDPLEGLVIDHLTLHGLLLDSRRIDASRLGNPATIAMTLESEGFKKVPKENRFLRGRYHIQLNKLFQKEWAPELIRLTGIMECTCGRFLSNSYEAQENPSV